MAPNINKAPSQSGSSPTSVHRIAYGTAWPLNVKQSEQDVTLLARDARLKDIKDIKDIGIVLEHALSGKRENDAYDLGCGFGTKEPSGIDATHIGITQSHAKHSFHGQQPL